MIKHNALSKESHKLNYINLVPCKHTFVSRQNNLKSLPDEESALQFCMQACIRNQCEYASAHGQRAARLMPRPALCKQMISARFKKTLNAPFARDIHLETIIRVGKAPIMKSL